MDDLSGFAEDIECRCEAIAKTLGLDGERVTLTVLELLSHDAPTLAAACEAEYAAMVRTASELTSDGYCIQSISTEAVAALYVAAAEVALGSGRCDPTALLEAQALLGEAVFMLGRVEILGSGRAEAQRLEQSRRRTAGAKGGRPRTIDDAAVAQFMIQWKRDHPSMRKSVTAAALQFNVTDKTIRAALKRLQT